MLKINYEFRKGIFFIRLIGDLDKKNYYKKEKYLYDLINYNGFKHIVLNTNMLRNIDLYGINYIACFCDVLKENNQELTLCDKSNLWENIFGKSIQSISSELEVFDV